MRRRTSLGLIGVRKRLLKKKEEKERKVSNLLQIDPKVQKEPKVILGCPHPFPVHGCQSRSEYSRAGEECT